MDRNDIPSADGAETSGGGYGKFKKKSGNYRGTASSYDRNAAPVKRIDEFATSGTVPSTLMIVLMPSCFNALNALSPEGSPLE